MYIDIAPCLRYTEFTHKGGGYMKPWMKHAILTAVILPAAIFPRAFVAGSNSNGLVAGVFAIAAALMRRRKA